MMDTAGLRAVFANLPGSAILLLPDGPYYTITAVTDNYLQKTGMSREKLIGTSFLDNLLPNSAQRNIIENHTHSLEYVLKHKSEHCSPAQHLNGVDDNSKNPGEKYWTIRNKPVLDENGKLIFIIQFIEDVALSVQANGIGEKLEDKLADPFILANHRRSNIEAHSAENLLNQVAEARNALRNAIDLAELSTWQLDVKTKISTYSSRAQSWWGLPHSQAPFQEIVESLHPEDREKVAAALEHAIHVSGTYKTEYRLINRITNEERFMQANGKVSYDENGMPVTIDGIVRDVTLQKMTQHELSKQVQERTRELEQSKNEIEVSSERLQAVFNNVQSGIFTFAPERDEHGEIIDFRFVITNPKFASYVGQTPEVLNGDLGSKWFPGYLHNGVFDMYKKTFLTGETHRMDVHYNVDGHDLYLDLLSTKAGNEVLVTFTDYTALKTAELQLIQFVAELKRSNSELEQFTYAASHDMQEPLRKIQTFSHMLMDYANEMLDEKAKGYLIKINSSVTRMRSIIEDLLQYSHLTQSDTSFAPTDLNIVMDTIESDLEVLMDEKQAYLCLEQLPVVQAVSHQMNQLFLNLITNSIKFSKPGVPPRIHIKATTPEDHELQCCKGLNRQREHVKISISDNGIGFSQDYAEQIFNLFTRLNGKYDYEGTGIGLSLCKKIVENHGGTIYAESAVGKGATFHLILPIA